MTSRARLAVLALLPVLALAGACGDKQDAGASDKPSSAAGQCSYPSDGSTPAKTVDAPPATPVTTKPTAATIKTSVGDIKVTLDADKAPCTVNSFLSLAKQGYYDNTTCHRLTTKDIFVLQCGDPTGTGSGGPGYSFADELLDDDPRIQPCQQQQSAQGPVDVCSYGPGTLAMANAGPDTNGSQFFLVYGNSPLQPSFTVFGHMDAAGLQKVKQVAKAGVGKPGPYGPTDGTPKTPVTITGVTVG